MFLGSLFQSLTTRLAMSFHLVLTEVYFAATCDGFLSVLCLLCCLSLGGKTAMRFLSAPTNIVFPIYTDPSLIIFSSTACLGPLTVLLERHQFVTGGSKTGPAVPSSWRGDTAGSFFVAHQNHHDFFLCPAPTGLQWMSSKSQCRILFIDVLGGSCQLFSCQSIFHLTAVPLKRSPALHNIHCSF